MVGRDQVLVSVFMDFENIRRGIERHFHKLIPQDISVRQLLEGVTGVVREIGHLKEGFIYGDWTLRAQDAREVERVPGFRTRLVLRSDSKKDRTDMQMSLDINDFFTEESEVNDILLCAGDSDYCELLRRGHVKRKNIYVCAVAAQAAPELISLARSFYSVEQRLGLSVVDPEELQRQVQELDPALVTKWAPLIRQLDHAETRLPYVVAVHFANKYLPNGLGYGAELSDKMVFLDAAVKDIGILKWGSAPHPESGRPIRTITLTRDHPLVKAVLAK